MKRAFARYALLGVIVGALAPAAIAQEEGYLYVKLTPCRLVDTRLAPGTGNPGQVGWSGQLRNRRNYFVKAKGNCGIPDSGPVAVALTVTAILPTDDGHIRMFPADAPAVTTSSVVNFLAGEAAVANGAIIPIQASGFMTGPAGPAGTGIANFGGNFGTGDLTLFMGGGPTGNDTAGVHVTIDVAGYFKP